MHIKNIASQIGTGLPEEIDQQNIALIIAYRTIQTHLIILGQGNLDRSVKFSDVEEEMAANE